MKLSLKSASSALVAALFLTSLSYVPVAEARGDRGGGGGGGHAARGGSGGVHPGGGAGGRPVDARANNVRSSSVNNVHASNRNTNINKNVNVNVNNNNRGGCCGGGWDNDYHPIATAAAVTATVAITSAVIGSMVRTVPAGCVPVNYGGMVYQQCGTTWYQPQGAQFVVIAPPY